MTTPSRSTGHHDWTVQRSAVAPWDGRAEEDTVVVEYHARGVTNKDRPYDTIYGDTLPTE
jgi:hypothetical protein